MASELKLSDIEFMTRGYRQRTIIVFAICYPFAIVSVLLRFVSRKMVRTNALWWDDWLAVVGLVMTGGFCACVLSCLPSDSLLDGKQEINNELLKRGALGAYTAELFYYCNQLSLKFSILCFYWRVFSSSQFMRRSGYYLGSAFILWFIASFIVAVLQCVPVQANWDPIEKAKPGVKCVDLNGFFFGTSIPNILADLILVLLPTRMVLQLKITATQKAFVIFFFVLGGFVVITSVIRLKLITEVNFATFAVNWSMDNSVLWTIVENCCGVISVCLPSLRPIIKLVPWKAFQHAFSRSQGTSRESKSRTKTGSNPFEPSRRSQWSQIEPTAAGSSGRFGIRKETTIDVESLDIRNTSDSSQIELNDLATHSARDKF